MAGYLDQYGAGDERRERIIKTAVISLVSLVVVAGIVFFILKYVIPNRRERVQVRQFFSLLAARDYKAAYSLWGCTDATPCRGYPMSSFLEDWGSNAVPVGHVEVLDGESCGSGVIVDVDGGKAGDKKLWVEKRTLVLSFSPFPDCPERDRIYDFVQKDLLRRRIHK